MVRLARPLPERVAPPRRGDLSFARTLGALAGRGTTRSPRPLSRPQPHACFMSAPRLRFWTSAAVAGAVVLGAIAVLAIGWIVGSSSGQGRGDGAASTLRILLQELVAQVEIDPAEGLRLRALPSDPRFSPDGRELYWEVEGPSGERLRSNSLGKNTALLPPSGEETSMRIRPMVGPDGLKLVGLEERVRFGASTVRVAVAVEVLGSQ